MRMILRFLLLVTLLSPTILAKSVFLLEYTGLIFQVFIPTMELEIMRKMMNGERPETL